MENKNELNNESNVEETGANWQIHVIWVGSLLLFIGMIAYEYFKEH